MLLAEAEATVEALDDHPPPGPSDTWVAKVYRDMAIARARDEYETRYARITGRSVRLLPERLTPFLFALAAISLVMSLLPRRVIDDVLGPLVGARGGVLPNSIKPE
jgi:hypothetical protein